MPNEDLSLPYCKNETDKGNQSIALLSTKKYCYISMLIKTLTGIMQHLRYS
jgi:hypothetical protein